MKDFGKVYKTCINEKQLTSILILHSNVIIFLCLLLLLCNQSPGREKQKERNEWQEDTRFFLPTPFCSTTFITGIRTNKSSMLKVG